MPDLVASAPLRHWVTRARVFDACRAVVGGVRMAQPAGVSAALRTFWGLLDVRRDPSQIGPRLHSSVSPSVSGPPALDTHQSTRITSSASLS